MNTRKLLTLFVSIGLAVGVMFTVALAIPPVQAQNSSQLFVPMLAPSPTANESPFLEVTNPVSDSDQLSDEKWSVYTSQTGGYSFRYPTGWVIEEWEGKPNTLLLRSPADPDEIKAVLEYLAYEKPESDNLLTWTQRFTSESATAGPVARIFTPVDSAIQGMERLHFRAVLEEYGQGYLITHGRLVLEITILENGEDDLYLLDTLASSITFLPDAPVNFERLFGPDALPKHTTLDEQQQFMDELDMITLAMNIRLETGETPAELLEAMPDWAQELYQAQLISNASIIEEIDRQRETPSIAPIDTEDTERLDRNAFEELEHEYNQSLLEIDPNEVWEPLLEPAGIMIAPTPGVANRRGLPARYLTPIRQYSSNPDINCGSSAHYNGTEDYAIDIAVATGTDVYATTQNETVTVASVGWNDGYGNMVRTISQNIGGGNVNTYYHIYAHLDQINVSLNDVLQPANLVGKSGHSGNVYPPGPNGSHLHFSIAQDNQYPVDLSAMKGVFVNLHYPLEYKECGKIVNPDNASTPLIIEANEYQLYYGLSSVFWNCSQYLPNHTGYCYRAVNPPSPPNPLWWHPYSSLTDANKSQTSRMAYEYWVPVTGTYYVWVCGMGGNVNSDSLYMGVGGMAAGSQIMTGYHSSNWVWRSIRLPDTYMARLNLSMGYRLIDMWARENTMRVDRILLVRDSGFNPTTEQIRCGGQGLH